MSLQLIVSAVTGTFLLEVVKRKGERVWLSHVNLCRHQLPFLQLNLFLSVRDFSGSRFCFLSPRLL